MKLTIRVAMATLISIGICIRSGKAIQTSQPLAVTACLSRDNVALFDATLAEEIASRMFARIGIALHWREVGHNCPGEAIVVSLTTRTPEGLQPHALAYTLPYEGTHIRVFLDRIRHQALLNSPNFERHLLAHVLVHEITHLLEGTNGHSDRGVMKARWEHADFGQMMTSAGLPFTPEDVSLIRRGLELRAAHPRSTIVAVMDYNWDTSLFGLRP
jgi:hypothetical protein